MVTLRKPCCAISRFSSKPSGRFLPLAVHQRSFVLKVTGGPNEFLHLHFGHHERAVVFEEVAGAVGVFEKAAIPFRRRHGMLQCRKEDLAVPLLVVGSIAQRLECDHGKRMRGVVYVLEAPGIRDAGQICVGKLYLISMQIVINIYKLHR